ncbi:chlorite dismutase family protein [Nitrospira sp. Nam74]
MKRGETSIKALCIVMALCVVTMYGRAHAADREKLLSDPGIYATFAAFKVDPKWWQLDKGVRDTAIAAAKEVVRQHEQHIAIDTYLLRGLSEHADVLFRTHSLDMIHNQTFLVDLMGTTLGAYLVNTSTFNGMTKKANYVPNFPDETKAALKAPTDAGPKPYAVVIPIRKDAAWWLLTQEMRTRLMKEHTDAALPYLKTVKRKLYHSTGLDDFDFITYFETENLADFNRLVLALQQIKENQHNRRFGNPTLLGTIHSLDEILEVLNR